MPATPAIEPPAEPPGTSKESRGLRFLMNPVFCERMGPGRLLGPKRFTPTSCTLDDLHLVDAVCISQNHYDHLDIDAIKQLYANKTQKRPTAGMAPLQIFCGLGSKAWFASSCGIQPKYVTKMDWWDEVDVNVSTGTGTAGETVRLACTPSRHNSRRGPKDQNQKL